MDRDDFFRRVEEAQKALEAWPDKDKDLMLLLPEEAVCSLCWGAGRNPVPNHLIMIFCEHPALWVTSYRWDQEKGRLVPDRKFTGDGTAMEEMAAGVARVYLQRAFERKEGLPPSIDDEALVRALGGMVRQAPEDIQRAHDCLMAVLMGESPIGVEDNQKPLIQAGLEALCWVLGHDHIKTFGENLEKLGWQHMASINGEEEYRDV